MKKSRLALLIVVVLTAVIYSCSDDNSPGGSSNNNGGGVNTGGCAGGPTIVTDIDGNVYNVVSIGNQCWMKENLKTTHYRNGNPIQTNLTATQWYPSTTSGACADYDNNPTNTTVYGKLYNWYAVADPQGLCPTGWHIPTDSEWHILVKFIDSNADTSNWPGLQSAIVGSSLKEIGTTHWASPNANATNSSGFTALPGGYRGSGVPDYCYIGNNGFWWTATPVNTYEAFTRALNYDNNEIDKSKQPRWTGFSVRCVRD